MKDLKICLIGGGSTYIPGVVDALIKNKSISVKEICLLDVEEGVIRQNIIYDFVKGMLTKDNSDVKVYQTLNQKEALKDSDFVISMFRVGGNKARAIDEQISLKYNVVADESICVCALSESLRTIPVILNIIKDMQDVCPKAFLINLNNLGGIIGEAIFTYTKFDKFIGISNSGIKLKQNVKAILETDDFDIDIIGVSNLVYGLNLNLNGTDYLNNFIKRLMDKKGDNKIPFSLEFIKSFSIIPSDKHVYYYKKDIMLETGVEEFQMGVTRGQMLLSIESKAFEYYSNKQDFSIPDVVKNRLSYELVSKGSEIIDSIVNNKKNIFEVNTRNNGVIPSLDIDDSIEVSAIVGSFGAKPLAIGKLPYAAKGLIHQIKSFEKICAKAAVEGNYLTAYSALCIHPLMPSEEVAKKIIDDILIQHKKYLPKFIFDINRIEAQRDKKICKRDCSSCKNC